MKLDPRIEVISDIITCFEKDKNKVKNYVGQKGYFTDDMMEYGNLESCIYGELIAFNINEDYPFRCKTDATFYAFFIPECSLLKTKPKKEKYIPFETLNDLKDYKIHIGDPIVFFNKEYPKIRYSTIVTEIQFDNDNFTVINITLGSTTYSLETLCNNYIWHCCNNEWVPFGKKVEE